MMAALVEILLCTTTYTRSQCLHVCTFFTGTKYRPRRKAGGLGAAAAAGGTSNGPGGEGITMTMSHGVGARGGGGGGGAAAAAGCQSAALVA